MDDEERFEQLRENEIRRLTNSLGRAEPVKGILTPNEILTYAGDSVTASVIRLKKGIGTNSDKSLVNKNKLIFLAAGGFVALSNLFCLMFIFDNVIFKLSFFIVLVLVVGIYIYLMHVKDYSDPRYMAINESSSEPEPSPNEDLLVLFESKEGIAREMIEKRFPAPQMTNIKFNSVLDRCKDVVESQIEILNAITPTDKTEPEISSRRNLIKQVISKVDDLTNELILSEENDLENVIDEMDKLIATVNDY